MTGLAWAMFLVAAGVGAGARYAADGWIQERARGVFPWGTLAVNATGCLLAGVLAGLGRHHDLDSTVRTVLATGGLGAYTTFSTFTFESVRLVQEGAVDEAARNVAANVLVGLAAAGVGLALTSPVL